MVASTWPVFGWDSNKPGVQLNQQFVISQEQLEEMRALCDADEAEREENNEH
jgi:hypothetical protein